MDKEDEAKQIKRLFKNDLDLSRVTLLIYHFHPSSITEIKDVFNKFYQKHVERHFVYYKMKRLTSLGIVSFMGISDVNGDSGIEKEIKEKHKVFIERIPGPLKNEFNKIIYYYPSPYIDEFIEFISKNLGVKYQKNG